MKKLGVILWLLAIFLFILELHPFDGFCAVLACTFIMADLALGG